MDKGGYYLDFVDDFDEKVEEINKKMNTITGVHNLPNTSEFLKKIIKAEVITQFPDLGGVVPEGTDGFQGSIKIRRATPDKQIEEMKNTGVEDSIPVVEDEVLDPGGTSKYEEIVKSWSAGQELTIRATAKVYEQAESELNPGSDTGYWEEVIDETGRVKTIARGTVVEYTGTYKNNTNPMTGDVITYVEVKNGDETVYVRANYLSDNNKSNRSSAELKTKSVAKVTSRAGNTNKEKVGGEKESYVVAIAAGHNNSDDIGARSGDLIEEDLTVEVAEKVQELIEERFSNITVVQTGSTSSNRGGISLDERTQLAKNENPDLCIQIHFNSNTTADANGVEVIYADGDGISQQLAEILSNTISSAMGLNNRGAGTDTDKCGGSLAIIENAATSGFPSVVTEGGFLSGNIDADVIKNGGVDKYAEGIVEGIKEYLEADHSGYTATEIEDQTVTEGIRSVVRNLKYVPLETMEQYIANGNTEALRVFSLDDQKNLITATWSSSNGNIQIRKNSTINLKTALEKYILPYEYLLFFYIDTDYEDFSEDLADEIIDNTEIVIALQDNVTTTQTTTTTEQRRVDENGNTTSSGTVGSSTDKNEICNTSIDVTYVKTWCVKAYQENSYSSEVLDMGDAESKVVTIKGKVTELHQPSSTNWTTTSSGTDGENSYSIQQRTTTDVWTISNQYESGEMITEGNESTFVKLYNEHDMYERVRSDYLFTIIEQNERTSNLLDLTKYLMFKATNINYGVIEYDFSEFSLKQFSSLNGGFYGSSIQEKVWWAVIDAGYSKEAAAGVLGNIEAESGFNQAAIEGGNGIGFGLCQWSFGRRTALEAYAASKGVEPSDVNTQIEFLIGEITPGGGANGYATYQLVSYNGYSASDWSNASTPEDAAIAFCWSFERPGKPRMNVRTEAARKYYEQFKDLEKPTGGNVTSIQAVLPNYPFSSSSGFGWRNGPFLRK